MYRAKRLLALLSLHPLSSLTKFNYYNRINSPLSVSFSSNNMADTTDTSTIAPTLDKNVFNNDLNLIALKIPAKKCTEYAKAFKDYVWKRPRMKKILNIDNEPDYRLLLLSEDTAKAKDGSDLPKELQEFIHEQGGEVTSHVMNLTYENLSVEEVLHHYFPDRDDIPSSFEQCGHLAHMNLRPEYIKYKHIIGQVIIDKLPQIKTVVNKVGNIETQFRTFPMELLAGEDNYNVTLKEYGAKFTFDFRKVYWNSRLQMEHSRLINMIRKAASSVKEQQVVADIMCGIGPFAVPLAMNGVEVHANDLNPASYDYLMKNAQQNKCTKLLHCYNLDGRTFVIEMAKRNIAFDHAPMNLPQTATEFLDSFIGLRKRYDDPSCYRTPTIHVYAFSTADDVIDDVRQRCAATMRISSDILPADSIIGHIVRDVAPRKMMVCLSFALPDVVADADPLDFSNAPLGKHPREGEPDELIDKESKKKSK